MKRIESIGGIYGILNFSDEDGNRWTIRIRDAGMACKVYRNDDEIPHIFDGKLKVRMYGGAVRTEILFAYSDTFPEPTPPNITNPAAIDTVGTEPDLEWTVDWMADEENMPARADLESYWQRGRIPEEANVIVDEALRNYAFRYSLSNPIDDLRRIIEERENGVQGTSVGV